MSASIEHPAVDSDMGSSGEDALHSTKLESTDSGWGKHVNHAPISLSLGHLCSDGNSEDSSSVSAAGSGDGPYSGVDPLESPDSVDCSSFVLSQEATSGNAAPVNTLSIVSVESIREKSEPLVTSEENSSGKILENAPGLIRANPLQRLSADSVMVPDEEFIGNVLSIPEPSDSTTLIEIDSVKSLIPPPGDPPSAEVILSIPDSSDSNNLMGIKSIVSSDEDSTQQSKTPMHKCDICNRKFKHKMHLARHRSVHNCVCTLCKRSFSRQEQLQNHLREHEIKLYPAKKGELTPVGDLTLTSSGGSHRSILPKGDKEAGGSAIQMNFYKEISSDSTEKLESLSLADESSPSPVADSIDMLIGPSLQDHNGLYVCKFCERTFDKVKNLRIHEHKHARKKHLCNVCGKEYTLKGSLYAHMRTHESREKDSPLKMLRDRVKVTYYDGSENESPAEEEVGNLMLKESKQVPSLDLLQSVPTTSPVPVFRHFLDNSPLLEVKTEPLSLNYSCTYCEKRFLYYFSCQVHQEKHQQQQFVPPSTMMYSCSTCGMRFLHKERLEVHKDKFHSNLTSEEQSPSSRLRCRFCLKDFQTELLLHVHEESHTEELSGMATEDSLIQRLEIVPTSVHRIPLNSDGYICVDCGERCSSPLELEEHRKIHISFLLQHSEIKPTQLAPTPVSYYGRSSVEPKDAVKCFKCFNLFLNEIWFKKHVKACWQPSEKPKNTVFYCLYCSQCLTTEDNWSQHQLEHFCQMDSLVSSVEPLNDDEKPVIVCSRCDQWHHGIVAFNKHMWEAHGPRYKALKPAPISIAPGFMNNFSNDYNLPKIQSIRGNVSNNMQWEEFGEPLSLSVKEKPTRKIEASLDTCNSTDIAFKIELKRNRKRKKCTVCRRWFANRLYFLRHIQAKHRPKLSKPKPRLTCTICGKVYSMNAFLEKHMRSHDEELNTGGISSEGLAAVYKTYLSNVSGELMECKYCEFKCPSMRAFINHVKCEHYQKRDGIHLRERLYKCRFCARHFPSDEAWLKHENDFHTGLRSCPYCGKDFEHNRTLQSHMAEEHGDKGSSISDSETTSPTKKRDGYTYDKLRTKDDGIIPCPFCKKIFTKKRWLKTHVTVRHKRKFKDNAGPSFKCDGCGKKFSLLTALEKHSRFCNSNLVLHKCKFCDQTYKKRYWLKMHMRSHMKDLNHPSLTETTRTSNDRMKVEIPSGENGATGKQLDSSTIENVAPLSTCEKEVDSPQDSSERMDVKCKDVPNPSTGHLKIVNTTSLSNRVDSKKKQGSKIVERSINTLSPKSQVSAETRKSSANVCSICHKDFITPEILKKHTELKHIDKDSKSTSSLFKCNLCLRSFTEEVLLEKHLKVHAAESYKKECHVCQKKFHAPDLCIRHIQLYHPDETITETSLKDAAPPFEEPIQQPVEDVAQLKKCAADYMIDDYGKKVYQCMYCPRVFYRACSLGKHKKTHVEYQPDTFTLNIKDDDVSSSGRKRMSTKKRSLSDFDFEDDSDPDWEDESNDDENDEEPPYLSSQESEDDLTQFKDEDYVPETKTREGSKGVDLKVKREDFSKSPDRKNERKRKRISNNKENQSVKLEESPGISTDKPKEEVQLEENPVKRKFISKNKEDKGVNLEKSPSVSTDKPKEVVQLEENPVKRKFSWKNKEDKGVNLEELSSVSTDKPEEEPVDGAEQELSCFSKTVDKFWPNVRIPSQEAKRLSKSIVKELTKDVVKKLLDMSLPANLNDNSFVNPSRDVASKSSGKVCQTCGRVFTSISCFEAHTCDLNSSTESNDRNGYDLKIVTEKFKVCFCLLCNRSSKTKKGARIHLTKAHKLRSCVICDQVFSSEQAFFDHESFHTLQKTRDSPEVPVKDFVIECKGCNSTFESLDELNAHELKCAPEKEEDGSKYSIFEFTDEDVDLEKKQHVEKKSQNKKNRKKIAVNTLKRGKNKSKNNVGFLKNYRKLFSKTSLSRGVSAKEMESETRGEKLIDGDQCKTNSSYLKEKPSGLKFQEETELEESSKLSNTGQKNYTENFAEKESKLFQGSTVQKVETEKSPENQNSLRESSHRVEEEEESSLPNEDEWSSSSDKNELEEEDLKHTEDVPTWGKHQNICRRCGKICKNDFWLKKHSIVCSGSSTSNYQCMDIAPVTATLPDDIFQETSDEDETLNSKPTELAGSYFCDCTQKFTSFQEYVTHVKKCPTESDPSQKDPEEKATNTSMKFTCECNEKFASQYHFDEHKLGCASWLESENVSMLEEETVTRPSLHDISMPPKRRKYQCKCNKIFSKSYLFSKHISYCSSWKEGSKPTSEGELDKPSYRCCFCSSIFRLSIDYVDHIAQHLEPEHRPLLTCHVCQKSYQYQSSLEKHLLKFHHVESGFGVTYTCAVCNASYATPGRLLNHVPTHKPSSEETKLQGEEDAESGKFTCEWCYQQFQDQDSYIQHLDGHTDLEESLEDMEGEINSPEKRNRLDDSESSISGNILEDGTLKCDQCNMSFERRRQLQNHLRRHKNATKTAHSCPVCLKTFYYLGPYESHVKLHNVQSSQAEASTSKRTLTEASHGDEANSSRYTCEEFPVA